MTVTDEQRDLDPLGVPSGDRPAGARAAINQMIEAGLLDDVMARAGAGELRLTGEGGFLPEMIKAVLERGLAAELTGHLGYEKGDPAGRGSPNSRNGSSPKTLSSEVGEVALAVPRDRAGTFEPRLVPKGARRAGGLDDMIISLYAGGMTVGPSCPTTPSRRSPTGSSTRSRRGRAGRWKRSTRSSTWTRWW
jgi:putative transposase